MKYAFLFTMALALFAFTIQPNAVSENTVFADSEGVEIGDKAPFFKLKNVDGKEYSFENIVDGNGNKPKGYIITELLTTAAATKPA